MLTLWNMSYFLFFISLSLFGQENPKIELIQGPKSLESYDHQFKGCLENSECDQVMGLQLTRWNDLINKVKQDKIDYPKKSQYLELFRSKYGIPVEFYTYQKSQLGHKPLLFNSPCKNHNKEGQEKVLKGISFVKSVSKDRAVIWRDQTQIEVPMGELLLAQPVIVYSGDKPTTYQLPIGDQPLFIKNNELYVLKDEDDFFYVLKISSKGDWKIENLDMSRLSGWEEKRSDAICPKDTTESHPKVFEVEFCKNIWDEDLKKTVIVKMHLGCLI